MILGSPDFMQTLGRYHEQARFSETVGRRGAAAARRRSLGGGRRRWPGRLVVILLRGAVDGLNVVVPCFEPAYYELGRPSPSGARGHRGGAAARRPLRPAPEPCRSVAAVGRQEARLHPCRGFARSDAIAFRRAAVHRERHPRTHRDPGRLDEPPACGAARPAWADPGGQHRPDPAADSEGRRAGRQPGTRSRGGKANAARSAGSQQGLRPVIRRERRDRPGLSRRAGRAYRAGRRPREGNAAGR